MPKPSFYFLNHFFMEENKSLVREEETLNANDPVEPTEAKQEEVKTYSQEELDAKIKELQSNSEKGVQKIFGKVKTLDRAIDEIGKVAQDNTHLVTLYEENPEIAQIILEKFYDGQTIDEYKASIDFKEDLTDPKIVEKKVRKEIEREHSKKLVDSKKSEFIERLKMSDKEKKEFEDAFAERMQLKSFSVDNLEKHLEKAYIEISEDNSSLKEKAIIGKSMAT